MHQDIAISQNHELVQKDAVSMKNKLLKQNKGKVGSYTILVKKEYCIPKHDLKYYASKILERKNGYSK